MMEHARELMPEPMATSEVRSPPFTIAEAATVAENCYDCECARSRHQVVIYDGPTDPYPALMVLGQSPGAKEDDVGRPFIGPSGTLLRQTMADVQLPPAGFFNIINCRPPFSGFRYEYAERCRPQFRWKLMGLSTNLRWLICAGRDAQAAITASFPPWREGVVLPNGRRIVTFSTLHPAAVLRAHGYLDSEWSASWRYIAQAIAAAREEG